MTCRAHGKRAPLPIVTVVVCTFRRAELLERFLPKVCSQELRRHSFEVLVVDNGSRDRTPQVVADLSQRFRNLSYSFEPRRGLSHARNRGWQEARGEYVAYLDDDCRVPPGWLAVAEEVIEQHAPVELGGPIHGFHDRPPPRWWRQQYDADHSHRFADAAGYLAPHQEIYGGNLFLRRRTLEQLGGFDPTLGMDGRHLGYGEEWDLHRRLRRLHPNHLAYYEPRLQVEHLIRREKLSLLWHLREQMSRGRDTHRIGCGGKPLFSLLQAICLPAGAILELARAGLGAAWRRDRAAQPYWQNYLYEDEALRVAFQRLGQLRAQWAKAPRWCWRAPAEGCRCRLGLEAAGAQQSHTPGA